MQSKEMQALGGIWEYEEMTVIQSQNRAQLNLAGTALCPCTWHTIIPKYLIVGYSSGQSSFPPNRVAVIGPLDPRYGRRPLLNLVNFNRK